jgi:uncharacterized membrane protein
MKGVTMTQLICLVQRLYLGDEKRTLIKENETFEADEKAAEMYIKGGIAKIATIAAPIPPAAPEPAAQPEPEPIQEESPDGTVSPEAEKAKKKKGR